jgi:hypothetical protein
VAPSKLARMGQAGVPEDDDGAPEVMARPLEDIPRPVGATSPAAAHGAAGRQVFRLGGEWGNGRYGAKVSAGFTSCQVRIRSIASLMRCNG